MIGLDDVRAAAERIAPYIRSTPVVKMTATRQPLADAEVWMKLESLQPTGSFKARGATNRLLTTPRQELAAGIVTASGGNHGLATARAATIAGVTATVFVPETAEQAKIEKLRAWGAEVRVEGAVWDATNRAALAFAKERNAAYFHPFADPQVVAGQGTIGLELIEALPELDTVLVAIGGGGLISGISVALKALKPSIRIVGIEPAGSPTLQASLAAGHVVTLPAVTTRIATMACGRTDERIFGIVQEHVDEIILVGDEDMQAAARWLWFEFGIAADLSGAAGIAALRSGKLGLPPRAKIATLICGAGSNGIGMDGQ
ncbi:serine/threonine dehydratase [Mesorhizobium sp. LCM 4577]|uniref:threonine ammonia-lyase n=1 Tax=Mesorhizobium sp. LCM 4577 TaxID=1848288 RepID=UPI0008D93687|nr:threonine/serine dehydratase [Mesorhizobium sp. LCM 4577]OHV68043.1 serine/threonine dehydratase [Mesorhizobium sp. LCM 4577]